ncbi:MAG TPA: ParB/RepB/Spo0J family partition protein [Planctomycetaceae bacterium]|nr:ParB/RepB/Spo0J family partition protein [Planctomycetaceae bacterium]HRA87314.1 ParB/RepB/Spo0J family partition protein [Planctomycetaceae bacterium]
MQTTLVRISDLQAHQLQQDTYGHLSCHEFAALKADIARRGVRSPIEISRSKIIIDGHQRVRACRELGIDEIDAIICQDDAQDAIDESFVLANLVRRHLDPVAKAKALQALVDIERRRINGGDPQETGDLRDRIARRLGGKVSGRTVDRLLQLIRLPPAICQAISANELPMTIALKVEKMSPTIQQAIADRIAAGDAARAVVAEYLPRKDTVAQEETPADLYYMLVDFLGANISILNAACDDLTGTAGDHERTADVLEKTEAFCKTMHFKELSAHSQSLDEVRELFR